MGNVAEARVKIGYTTRYFTHYIIYIYTCIYYYIYTYIYYTYIRVCVHIWGYTHTVEGLDLQYTQFNIIFT